MREPEKPQHESFDGRNYAGRQVRQKLYRVVEEFAVKQGWSSVTKTGDLPGREQERAADRWELWNVSTFLLQILRSHRRTSAHLNQVNTAYDRSSLVLLIAGQVRASGGHHCHGLLDLGTPTSKKLSQHPVDSLRQRPIVRLARGFPLSRERRVGRAARFEIVSKRWP